MFFSSVCQPPIQPSIQVTNIISNFLNNVCFIQEYIELSGTSIKEVDAVATSKYILSSVTNIKVIQTLISLLKALGQGVKLMLRTVT